MTIAAECKTIMITRPRRQAQALACLLEARGARVHLFPTLEISPLDDYAAVDAALGGDIAYDWLLLSSSNGAEWLGHRLAALGLTASDRFAGTRVAAIGPSTAAAAAALGLEVALVPARHVGEALAEALIATGIAGKRVLSLRSQLAREAPIDLLNQAGALVTDLAVYTSIQPADADLRAAEALLANGGIDAIAFASGSAVEHFAAAFGERVRQVLQDVLIASIGPITSERARALLGRVDREAAPHSLDGLVDALMLPSLEPAR
jgi:uroporphyrinogen III methyltransferase/synthase